MSAENTVRLKSLQGSDEINIECVSYKIHSDGAFYLTPRHAEMILATPQAGFFRAPAEDFPPDEGTVSTEQLRARVFGLAPGPLKDRLLAALKDPDLTASG